MYDYLKKKPLYENLCGLRAKMSKGNPGILRAIPLEVTVDIKYVYLKKSLELFFVF